MKTFLKKNVEIQICAFFENNETKIAIINDDYDYEIFVVILLKHIVNKNRNVNIYNFVLIIDFNQKIFVKFCESFNQSINNVFEIDFIKFQNQNQTIDASIAFSRVQNYWNYIYIYHRSIYVFEKLEIIEKY